MYGMEPETPSALVTPLPAAPRSMRKTSGVLVVTGVALGILLVIILFLYSWGADIAAHQR